MREGEQGHEAPARARIPDLLVGIVGLAIGVGFLIHLRAWLFVCDDAFISFRYAHNLAAHGALAYNLPPYDAVEGYTNLLWVVVLAVGELVGLAPERLAPILTAAAALASMVLAATISAMLRRAAEHGHAILDRSKPDRPRALGPRGPARVELVDLCAPALLATVPEFVVWGSGGLETSLALALGLLAVHLWLAGRIAGAAVAAAATGLTRLDELLWLGSFGLAWLAIRGLELGRREVVTRPAIPWRRVAVGLALFAAPLVAQLLVRHALYGEWLPNTWAVKRHGAALRDFHGRGYLEFWAASLALVYLAPLLVLLRPRHLLLAAPIAVQLIWAWSIGGDFMAYGRFVLPATALLAVLVGLALDEGRLLLADRTALAQRRATLVSVGVAALLVALSAARIPARIDADRARAHLHIPGPDPKLTPGFEGVDAMHRFAAVRLAAGRALAEAVPPDTLITVGAAGALPYGSRLPALDSYGLVDPGVVEVAEPRTREQGARPGHQLHAPLAYMLGHDPDLVCHIGYAGERLPPRGWARRRGARGPWVGWACVETGAIPDPRAGSYPSQYYCCLRPRDRFTELDEQAWRQRRSP